MEHKYHKTREEIEAEFSEIRNAVSDPACFSVLYDRYFDVIFSFMWKRVEDEDTAADLVHQVFLKAMINLKKFEFRGLPFSSWLFRIAVNEANMHFRKPGRTRILRIADSQAEELAAEIRDTDKEETLRIVLAALPKLPQDDFQLLELRFFEELSFAEIGSVFSISENNAKVRCYRAIEKLKKILEPEMR